jgi:diaminopimelate decarboxylase
MYPIEKLKEITTPFYYYDTQLLQETLDAINAEVAKHSNYQVHYAIKANANPKILKCIQKKGLGVDCVSGGEINAALSAGFDPAKIVFAGVGKSDWEIKLALENNISCFNVESVPELEVINGLALEMNKVARVAFRINPNVGAHTHANITTGLAENKFGIAMKDIDSVFALAKTLKNIEVVGLHFHIGSQILEMDDFKALCKRINEIQEHLSENGINVKSINVGGGLGVDYDNPDTNRIPDFKSYFETYQNNLNLRDDQDLHFELGRSVVAQCGALVTRVLYVKQGEYKQFAIVDAGMTDLIRPALYQAHHSIQNITSTKALETYDVVGPICESSDVFAKGIELTKCQRGDLLVLKSAGAYGEIMASRYNCRQLPIGYTNEDL